MEKKHIVINKHGQKIRLNDAALAIAERHFGVNKARPNIKEKPIELLKLPKKIDIIKAEVKVVRPVGENVGGNVVETALVPEVIAEEVKVAEVKVVKRRKAKK